MSEEEKPLLKPANENPWYCLATVYGELEEPATEDIAKPYRIAWNRWMAAGLPEEQRGTLVERGFDSLQLIPLSEEERTEFLEVFAKRTTLPPPDPKEAIDFHSVRFERSISFSGLIFPTNALFEGAAFAGSAFFLKTEFVGFAKFDKATFSDSAIFNNAIFTHGASFSDATFSSASFDHATFVGLASFTKATFTKGAIFNEAIFSFALFWGVTFPPVTRFSKATFSRGAHFSEATFGNEAHFDQATFAGAVFFSKAVFTGLADFTSCEFKSHTEFDRAKFESSVPTFFDSRLREATLWAGSTWPPPPKDQGAAAFQVLAYERLKAEMERLNRNLEAQFFFAKELRAQRARETRYSPRRALNFAYQILSGYGQSVRLPVFWLVMVFVFGASLFALMPVYKGIPLAYDEAAGLSITNLISFLPYKVDNEISAHLSPYAKIVGDLQSLLGVILLFLLGLALRNRFRMK